MKKKNYTVYFLIIFSIFLTDCSKKNKSDIVKKEIVTNKNKVSIIVLGTVQDAGSPQIACNKKCCVGLFNQPDIKRKAVSLGVVDREHQKKYLFDATPNIVAQIKNLKNFLNKKSTEIPDGVFLTHAHIGHYTGLMYFGKEAMNSDRLPVYAMPKMEYFLKNNGPWSQLVSKKNILLKGIKNENEIKLSSNLKVIPFRVPHRDEFSETVGYTIVGPHKKALFIPDIDKWGKWDKKIIDEIKKVDYAFLDATFFSGKEINNRDISQIPHPFIIESMKLFKKLNSKEKKKIIFIHFNHTNPVLLLNSEASKQVLENGFKIARINDVYDL